MFKILNVKKIQNILVPLTVRSFIYMLKDDSGAMSIATIPLDTYPTGAANTIIAYQAHVGIDQLLLCFIYLLILFRYRCLLPLGYLFITLEFGLAIPIIGSGWKPMVFRGTAPGFVVMCVLPFVTSLMCLLSLPERVKSNK